MTLGDIIELARAYGRARGAVQEVADDILERQRQAVRSRLRALKGRTAEMAAARDALEDAVRRHPDLFAKPRSQEVDQVRFGLRQRQGDISFADEDALVNAIYLKLPPELAPQLIQKKVTVSRTALRKLDPKQLKKIGVTVADSTDEVTITAPNGALDRMIAGMLSDGAAA